MSELKEILKNISEEKNEKIIPENIKAGVQIFDVTGKYEGEGEIYSMDEIVIGKWIDGKPLYRKVVKSNVPTVQNQNATAEATVLVAENIDFAMIKTAIASPIDGHEAYLPTSLGVLHISVFMKDDNYFTIYNRGFDYYNGLAVIAVIEYTKKTDEATIEI